MDDIEKEIRFILILIVVLAAALVVGIAHPYAVSGSITGTVMSSSYKDYFTFKTTRVTIASYSGSGTHFDCYGDYTDKFDIGSVYKISWTAEPFKYGIYTITEISKVKMPGLYLCTAVE